MQGTYRNESRGSRCNGMLDPLQKGRLLLQTPQHPEHERDKAAGTLILRPYCVQPNLMEHDGLRIAMNVKSFVLSAGGRTCPRKAAMTSRRMQDSFDPSPMKTRHRACGEGAPIADDIQGKDLWPCAREYMKEHSDVYKQRTVQTI